MTIASINTLAYFVKSKEITQVGTDGKQYKKGLLYVTYSKSLPQMLVTTSTNQLAELLAQGLMPGNFLSINGSIEILTNDKNPLAEHISTPQQAAVYSSPTIAANSIVLQPAGCTSMGNVVIVGRNGADLKGVDKRDKPYYRITDKGLSILKLSLAVSAPYKGGPSTWFNVTAFGKKADTMYNYVEKGQMVAVDGRLDLNSWTSKVVDQDTLEEKEVQKYDFQVKADNFRFISVGGGNGGEKPKDVVTEAVAQDDNSPSSDWSDVSF